MNLSTDVKIQPIEQRIVYGDKLLFLGSCFADEIGNICKGLGFDALVNPFGVLFNPASICQSVERLESGKDFTKDDVIEVGGEFYCTFSHNTEFWNPSPEKLLETVNGSLNSARQHFLQAKWIVISLGTSWIYRHKQCGLIVSNCHKLPSQLFQREFLTAEQSTELLSQLVEKHKDKQFIFTISPLRHLKDGLHENQISKAALLLAVDEICKRWAQRMDDIMAFTLCSDEPVVAEIIGNLVFKNVYGYSPIDATKLFGPIDEVDADVDETVELVLYCIDIALKGVGN